MNGFDQSDCKQNQKFMALQQLLHQEKSSPELLPYQHVLINNLTKQINKQEELMQVQVRDTDDRFYYNIHKMELERIKYLVKSYLRTRLFKIEKFLFYIVEKDQAGLLSEGEMQYTWQLYESKKNHFNAVFFNKVPSRLNTFEQEQLEDRLSK